MTISFLWDCVISNMLYNNLLQKDEARCFYVFWSLILIVDSFRPGDVTLSRMFFLPFSLARTITSNFPLKAGRSGEEKTIWQVASPLSVATISPSPSSISQVSRLQAVGTQSPFWSAILTVMKASSCPSFRIVDLSASSYRQ